MITLHEFLENRTGVPEELIKRAGETKTYLCGNSKLSPEMWEALYSKGADYISTFLDDDCSPIFLKGFPPLCDDISTQTTETKPYKSIYGLKVAKHVAEFAVFEDLAYEKENSTSQTWCEALHGFSFGIYGTSSWFIASCLEEICNNFRKINLSYVDNCYPTYMMLLWRKSINDKNYIQIFDRSYRCTMHSTKRGVIIHPNGVCLTKHLGHDMDQIEEVVDLLADLRNCKNVRFPFGILTTYEKWRIIWFEDSDIAAKETSINGYDELCRASLDVFCPIAGSVRVCMSRVYENTEVELIFAIATMMYKTTYSPAAEPKGFLEPRRAYMCLTEDTATYQYLPAELASFSYDMPEQDCPQLFVLVFYRSGSDGNVALCCSADGRLCVVKFMTCYRYGCSEKDLGTSEAEIWNRLWGTNCYVKLIMGRWAFVMPFCFSIRRPRGKFIGLNGWTTQLENKECWSGNEFRDDEVRDVGNLNMVEFLAFNKVPIDAAEIALKKMFSEGIFHQSIKWDHVALFPKFREGQKEFDLIPVFLDLTKMTKSDSEEDCHVAEMEAAVSKLLLYNR